MTIKAINGYRIGFLGVYKCLQVKTFVCKQMGLQAEEHGLDYPQNPCSLPMYHTARSSMEDIYSIRPQIRKLADLICGRTNENNDRTAKAILNQYESFVALYPDIFMTQQDRLL